jgi:hypothetical protein
MQKVSKLYEFKKRLEKFKCLYKTLQKFNCKYPSFGTKAGKTFTGKVAKLKLVNKISYLLRI